MSFQERARLVLEQLMTGKRFLAWLGMTLSH